MYGAMKRIVLFSLASAVLSTTSALAQVRFEGPQFGYLFDEVSKSVRALSGVPGAAALEDSIPAGFSVDRAVISRRGFALVASKAGGAVFRLSPSGAREMGAADLWSVSPSGSWGVLYSRASGKVTVWDLSPDDTESKTAEFSSPELKAVAISDDGTPAGIAGSVLLEISASGTRAVASGRQMAAVAYFPGSRDLAASDLAGQVLISRNGATTERDAAVGGALAVSRDGRNVIASTEDGVWIWNVDQQLETRLSCECRVTEIRGVGRADVFHLAAEGENILLDLTNDEPRLARLPAAVIRSASVNGGGVK